MRDTDTVRRLTVSDGKGLANEDPHDGHAQALAIHVRHELPGLAVGEEGGQQDQEGGETQVEQQVKALQLVLLRHRDRHECLEIGNKIVRSGLKKLVLWMRSYGEASPYVLESGRDNLRANTTDNEKVKKVGRIRDWGIW